MTSIHAEQLYSRHITTADGLSGNTINEMVQDSEGYIWMATNNGLSRYDGYGTVNYSSVACDDSQYLQARIGRIYTDNDRKLLWLNTSTYQVACYDLRQARFVDWTGRGEWHSSFSKMMLTRQGMVVYGSSLGARIGEKAIALPDVNVLTVVEDSAGTVWLPTRRGIATLDDIVDKSRNVIAASSGREALFLTTDGEVLKSNVQTHRLEHFADIPVSVGRPQKVNVSFVWQGKWLLFAPEGTYAVDLQTGITSRPQPLEQHSLATGGTQQWQVANGLNQGTCEGYHFVGTRSGELWIFPDKGQAQHFQLIDNAQQTTNKGWLFHVAKDAHGHLFIATYGAGLYVYDIDDGTMSHYTADDHRPIIDSDYLMSAMTDRQGNIWIGSETAGAYCLTAGRGNAARYLVPPSNSDGEWGRTVTSVMANPDGTITTGMRNGRIYSIDASTAEMAHYARQQTVAVASLFTDSKGRRWMGTWGNGLFVDGQQTSLNDSITNASVGFVSNFAEDSKGNIWVSTWNYGIFCCNSDGSVRQVKYDDINLNRVNDIEITADGTLWMATNGGLCRLSADGSQAVFNSTNSAFTTDETHSLLLTGDTLWVTTSGGLLQGKTTADGQFSIIKTYSTADGLSNDNTAAAIQDLNGNIWVGSEDGISRIVPDEGTVSSYRFARTAQGNISSKQCAVRMADGRLLFGTADGLLVIDPQEFGKAEMPHLHITNMTVNGTRYLANRPTELNHWQNSLWFTFTSFEYNSQQRPVFQYYLEGKERQWQNTTEKNYANYNELSPGHYVFHVRTLNAAGQWQQEETVAFTILQPWYNRWWAWALYALVLSLAVLYVYRNWRERFRLHQQMTMERQMSELRQNLFTNVTHEFRTPLAIIKGAVDKLAEDGSNKTARQTAQRATNRMLRMVNQFLEFRKIRTGKLRLQVEEGDLSTFVRDIVSDLWIIANRRNQQLSFVPAERHTTAVFDPQLVETIVYNLLSNAIKYTPEQGDIVVRLKRSPSTAERGVESGEDFVLTVEDNGPGISEEQQRDLFQPFMNGYAAKGGMGIGLYTSHQMATLHHGTLTYQQASDKGGSRFTLTLPANDCYTEEEHRVKGDTAVQTANETPQEDTTVETTTELMGEALNDYLVVIIEDNPDMMQQIKTEVGVYFKTACFADGRQALDGIAAMMKDDSQQQPSLVLCDIMLPDMTGYDIVGQLRADETTAALPVIMLTSLSDESNQIKAYKAGVDDYMVKPCNFRLLTARMVQLIKWNRQPARKPEEAAIILEGKIDKVFLEKLEMLTFKHLAEETFTVDRLAEMMSMGRTKFYGKVKELTGMSPNKYLQEARMRRAGELLLEGEYTIAEVSYKVGIQDPSYFNKLFKAHFGVVPSKYGRSS